jgi:hypothetical protein
MVPSQMAVRVANATVVACAIDVERGIYLRRSVLRGTAVRTVEQRWYAHRVRKSVLVMEMELLGIASAEAADSATIGLELYSIGSFMTDVDVAWTDVDDSSTSKMWRRDGATKQSENGSTPGSIRIAYVNTPVPSTVTLTAGSPRSFFGVGESTISDDSGALGATPIQRATTTWKMLTAMDAAAQARLSKEHAAAWLELWRLAVIELDTDRIDIKRAINSTLYGMLSIHDETATVPFPGSPLDGITLGSFGHWGGCYLWDADMWMYPALALWRPDFMSKMLQYRVDRLPDARANAKIFGRRGAKIPVMTCGSGAEATSSGGNITILGDNEIHESADVVFEAQQHWRLMGSSNMTWVTAVGLPLASGVADYYASRVSTRPGSDQLHMDAVCGPDEHNAAVNDSGYIIGSAITALNFAIELAELMAAAGEDSDGAYNTSGWKDVVKRLTPSLPYESALDFHPEFEGMPTKGFQAKQADTLMLQYPLMFKHSTLTQKSKLNDLLFYASHSLISPDMTQSIYSIVANELDQRQLAHSLFNMSYQRFNFPPYYTWSEKADGTGNVPYLTSGGGFLQSVTYGFVGLRAMVDRLRLRPQLIEGVSRMALRRIFYCGERIDVVYNASLATVTRADDGFGAGGWSASRLRIATEVAPEGSALPVAFPTGQVAHVLCARQRYGADGEPVVPRVETARFSPTQHGKAVNVSSDGRLASWRPGGQVSCNQVVNLNSSTSEYWVKLGNRSNYPWVDIGWCNVGVWDSDSWVGPSPKWLGYQAVGKAWLYRASGLYKASSTYKAPGDGGVKYGAKFGRGANITARRTASTLEFLVDGKSQGRIQLPAGAMPAGGVVGCVALCGGGAVELEAGALPPPGPSPPPLPPPPGPPPGPPVKDECKPWLISDTDDAGCGKWFPKFHPKNTAPLAHNNDACATAAAAITHHVAVPRPPPCPACALQEDLASV